MGIRILIKNGKIWDGDKFFRGDVLTEEKSIIKIADHIEDKATFTYNAAGQIVSVGLVDAHAHFRGVSAKIYGISPDAACFPFGVTAGVDVSAINGNGETLGAFAVKTKVLAFIGIREDEAVFTNTEKAFANYGDQVIGLKVCFSAPAAQTIKPLRQASAYARERGLPLMVHCSDCPVPMMEIVEWLQAGDILTHPYHGGEHTAAEENYACLIAARRKGIWLDAGFAGNVHTDFNVLRGAAELGIFPDTISTDITRNSAFKRGGRYGMTMCMNMCLTVGMPEEDIFRAVTSSPAKMLNMEENWGKLQVGRPADIAVFQLGNAPFRLKDEAGNNLQNESGYRCTLTVADGDVVYREENL